MYASLTRAVAAVPGAAVAKYLSHVK